MEFFFLIDHIWPEVLIASIALGTMSAIWSYDLFLFGMRVYEAFEKKRPIKPRKTKIQERIQKRETDTPKQEIPEIPTIKTTHPSFIHEHVETLVALIANARTLIARGQIPEARTVIVEGLALDKDNRDLNMLLGQIYEQEGQYEKAEYIYKDLAHLHPNDVEILERLGNALIVEKKRTIAYEIYKKIYTLAGEKEETLYMLTHLSQSLEDHGATLLYARTYLRSWPKNPEILQILGQAEVILGERKAAIETYKNLRNLTPYNEDLLATLQKLMVEEELANNFQVKEI